MLLPYLAADGVLQVTAYTSTLRPLAYGGGTFMAVTFLLGCIVHIHAVPVLLLLLKHWHHSDDAWQSFSSRSSTHTAWMSVY
jgi:hypothetical protein